MADKAQFQEAVKRGSAFAWRGQWADAAREYRQALALSPDDASALNYLAMALFKSGQLEEALECYRRVWKTQPANLSALQKVAEVQDAMGDKDSAIASYRQISDQQMKRNSPDEALKALQKVVELRPTEAESWSALMSVAALAGNLGDMIPRSLTLARELFLKDRFQDAFRVAEQVQSIDPTNLAVPRLIAAFRKGLEYSYRT
ncbi:MAG TPA: tetratricopeptide repeat protein, partial [Chloroflexota bacterium]|nr:tetratricopeptide repeat protein [Chloroflexota bacterium]